MIDKELNYSYVQVAYTILESKKTEDREYTSLETIKNNVKNKLFVNILTLVES